MGDVDARLAALKKTRRSLHGVAELVLAGPQYAKSASIELRVSPGGFATTADPDLRVSGAELVVGDQRFRLNGKTPAELAALAGVTPRDLKDVYADGHELDPTTTLHVDDAAATELAHAFALGDEALERLAPERKRVLWPEHFDVGIDADEVNYGVSPGDMFCLEPYAYVGPWDFARRTDVDTTYWNAPFGATRTIRELGEVADVLAFFEAGRDRS